MSAKKMKEGSTTTIKLSKNKITDSIENSGEYQEEGVVIKKWDGGDGIENFLAKIEKDNSQFIGVLNNSLEKEGYGMYYFPNGDKYFGSFKYDSRNYNGIYVWYPTQKDANLLTESYYGFWKDNTKSKYGIYMWLEEPQGNTEFDQANFDAYVGEIEGGTYKRGTFMQKIKDDYYVYHGNFDGYGRKNDDDAYFYSSQLDRVFHGKIANDVFVGGYIAYFDSDGIIENIVYCYFSENMEVSNIVPKEQFKEEDRKNEENDIALFRNIILGIDYFGEIYGNYKEITRVMDEELNGFESFEDQEKFPNLMKLPVAYNKNNIYNDIEEKAFGRKIN